MTGPGYRTRDITEVFGFSGQRLQNWINAGLVRPSIDAGRGRGTSRIWSYEDMILLQVVRTLISERVPVRKIKRVVRFLKAQANENLEDSFLVVIGGRDVVLQNSRGVVSLLQSLGQKYFVWIVDVGSLVGDLRRNLRKLETNAKQQQVKRAAG